MVYQSIMVSVLDHAVQYALSGSLKIHTLLRWQYKHIIMSPLLSFKIIWLMGENFLIRRPDLVFHLAPPKNNTFIPQGL